MQPGEVVRLRATDEPLTVLAIVDSGGSLLLVRAQDEGEFEVSRDEVLTDRERHGCACCA